MTPLRIAVLAPVSWRVPPRHYGPWEQFASLLTEGLVARGVDVTLFATADSITSGRLASVVARSYSEDADVERPAQTCRDDIGRLDLGGAQVEHAKHDRLVRQSAQ